MPSLALSNGSILAIGAHPDDLEFGCGGTLAAYARTGVDVYLFVATDGGQGGDPAVRRREQEGSAAIMGARKVFWGGYHDTELPLSRELIERLEHTMHLVRPSLILVHSPGDTHQDHRHVAQAATSATRYVPNFLFYEGPSTQRFAASCYVDIAAVLDIKLACLEAHRSQVTKTNIEDLTISELAMSTANFRGTQARVKYAEAFHSVRLLLAV